MGRYLLVLLVWVAASGSTDISAHAKIVLSVPVACTIGERCLIQKYFDHEPTSARLDYRCGSLTTDGHDGIDFRLRTMADAAIGTPVLAAAAGIVLRVRDGEPDVDVRNRGPLNGREAGNAVVIGHGDGWETQYSHLRKGTVRVSPGQRVVGGDPVGMIGMSGNAEFPHLHFALRFQGQPVDPFTGPLKSGGCIKNGAAAGSLWNRNAARVLGYTPSALVAMNLTTSVPPASVSDRTMPDKVPGPSDPLVLWVDVIGAAPGDTQLLRIRGPDHRVVFESRKSVEGGGLSWFAYGGRRAPLNGWPPGRYSGEYELVRNNAVVIRGMSNVNIP